MIGFHFRDPIKDWPQAVARLKPGTPVKFFWTEAAREAKAFNPHIIAIRRHHIDHQDPYLFAADKAQAARNFFNTFVDGTFLQYAAYWNCIEELNEYASHTNPPAELAEKIEWAITCARIWHDEYRTRPELAHLRLVVGNLAIGNDWGANGWKVAQACRQYDALMGYHPYIPTRNGQAHAGEWIDYSGRWAAMDAAYSAAGYRVNWVFTEGGPIGYDLRADGGIGALHAEDGWLHPNVCAGDLGDVMDIMEGWVNAAAGTPAYAEGRVVGLTLFDSAFNGWKWFQFADQNLQAMATWSGEYTPPVVIPPPAPIPPPVTPPTDERARGIDVSHHQGIFPWEVVKRQNPVGLDFAFVRAGQGLVQDTQWIRNASECRRLDIPFGAYHFLRSDTSAAAQASFFAGLLEDAGLSLPAVVDVEKNVDDTYPTNAQVGEFVEVFQTLSAHPLIIYTSQSAWGAATGGATWAGRDGLGLWVAHYTTAAKPLLPAGWGDWLFWQYTSKGSLSGHTGSLDFNRFNGNVTQLRQYISQWADTPPPAMPALVGGQLVLEFVDGKRLTIPITGGVWS